MKRKTSKKKVQAKLKQTKEWLRVNRHQSLESIMDRFRRSLTGYYNYYCITDNIPNVKAFRKSIDRLLFKWLNRRSQRTSFNWEKFKLILSHHLLPHPTIKVRIQDIRREISYIT